MKQNRIVCIVNRNYSKRYFFLVWKLFLLTKAIIIWLNEFHAINWIRFPLSNIKLWTICICIHIIFYYFLIRRLDRSIFNSNLMRNENHDLKYWTQRSKCLSVFKPKCCPFHIQEWERYVCDTILTAKRFHLLKNFMICEEHKIFES